MGCLQEWRKTPVRDFSNPVYFLAFSYFHKIACIFLIGIWLISGCTRPPEEDAKQIRFAFWGSIQQQRAEEAIIRAFREENPDIEVETLVIGARYPEKIQAMMVGHVAPDVIMVEMTLYDEWASRGVLLDLTDLFHRLDTESPFLPVPRSAFFRERGIFALPTNAHADATYFNEEAFAAAGLEPPEEGFSWDWFFEHGHRLARRAGNPDAPTDYAVFTPRAISIFWQHGVALFDDPFQPREVRVNRPEAVEAVQFLRRLRASGLAVPPEVAADEGTFQLFRDGRVATFFTGRWLTPEFRHAQFSWDVRPFPAGPANAMTYHGGTSLAVWKHSPRREAALRFLEFYASPRGAAVSMQFDRTVPVFRELAYSDEFLSLRPPESMEVFVRTMEEGASRTNLYAPGSREVARLFNGRVQQALSSPDIPAQRIIDGLEEDLNRWLERMEARRNP